MISFDEFRALAWAHLELTGDPECVRRLYDAMQAKLGAAPRVVAIVEGGVVQSAFSDNASVEFSVIDRDNLEDADSQEEVDDMHRSAGFTNQGDFENKIASGQLKPIY